MHRPFMAPRPLSGPGLQFSLLLLVLGLFVLLAPQPPRNYYARGRPALLPGIQGPDYRFTSDARVGDDIVITVQADGFAFIGHKWYPAHALVTGITTHLAQSPRSRVLLRVDRSLPFRSVRALLRILQGAHIPSVFLVTYEAYPEEPGFPLPLVLKDAT